MPKNELLNLVLNEIKAVNQKIDEVRTQDIPNLKLEMQTLKTQVEERTGRRAMLISGVGGLIAVATSMAVAYFK